MCLHPIEALSQTTFVNSNAILVETIELLAWTEPGTSTAGSPIVSPHGA